MFRNASCIVIAFASVSSVARAADGGPINPDFEKDSPGEAPAGWRVPTEGYSAEVKRGNATQGEQYVRLSGQKSTNVSGFGNLMQSLDAAPYRGKMIRFRAMVRFKGDGMSQAKMWLRVDREGSAMGFYETVDARPITGSTWKRYEIIGDVAKDATKIGFGIRLTQGWSVDFDDVTLEILKDVQAAEVSPQRAVTDRGLANLTAFAQLFGYVRFFHPSRESLKTDWNDVAFRGVKVVESADSPAALANSLESFFHPIAPTIRVYVTGKRPRIPDELQKPDDTEGLLVVRWNHHGVSLSPTGQTGPYSSKRESLEILDGSLPDGVRFPSRPFAANLDGGVSCMVPLSLYERDSSNQAESDESALPRIYSAADRTTHLADVVIAWNVFQHFYPYFDVVKTDWHGALKSALRKAARDTGDADFLVTLQEMVAKAYDGHGIVSHSCQKQEVLPVSWTWVGDELVVLRTADGVKGGPSRGDVVEKIDGKPVGELYAKAEKRISGATRQWRRAMALYAISRGETGKEVALSLRKPDDSRYEVSVSRIQPGAWVAHKRPEKICKIKPGIYYIDVQRASDEDFKESLPKLQKAEGIIYDYRGYPIMMPGTMFVNIIENTCDSPQYHIPRVFLPDRKNMTFERGDEWHIPPVPPYLSAKKVFLIDAQAISRAESYLGIIEYYKLGELIGEPTAGTNGDVNSIKLPGGYSIPWTGMKVLKQDGSRHHGVGIQPTIPVSRTIKGIAAGRDEMLEKAIEVVSK